MSLRSVLFRRRLSGLPGRLSTIGLLAGVLATAMLALPAQAALKVGAAAPDFSAEAAVGGKAFGFRLSESLAKGPVVLYFYPKAFTSGCTVEAHAFAEATPQFQSLGATVVGLSNDDIETLKKFSVEACRNRFAVAADPQARVIRAYDAGFALLPSTADRISYVIDPQGRVMAVHASMDPQSHVTETLKAVERWKAAQTKKSPG
ncbi:MAG: peroxiredoxin [Burkholderiales bacterium]|mgnify:FL=1|jgi:peroxiredoxin|nr:peroxiredoxin [Burkholderiales bacterium]MBP6250659.1 peroxiredoxin [Leptothrix sp. (in: b-proteobacteria)]MBP7519259.1 peroxiredoxin [Leptothrix sp. (in: b-proteobacteria)]